jgi:hypothetical protein
MAGLIIPTLRRSCCCCCRPRVPGAIGARVGGGESSEQEPFALRGPPSLGAGLPGGLTPAGAPGPVFSWRDIPPSEAEGFIEVVYAPIRNIFPGGVGLFDSLSAAGQAVEEARALRISQGVGSDFHYSLYALDPRVLLFQE